MLKFISYLYIYLYIYKYDAFPPNNYSELCAELIPWLFDIWQRKGNRSWTS